MRVLSRSGQALIVTLLFRLFFGGYLAGKDQYFYNDTGSSLTVIVIYFLLAVFAIFFLVGSKFGVIGIMGLSIILIILHTIFIFVALGQPADSSIHDPVDNLWATILRYVFFVPTMIFSLRVYRET